MCKEGFKHLVEMQDKYGKDGLTVMSVNIDDPTDQRVRARVRDFLKAKGEPLTNLVLAPGEKSNDWFDNKLKLEAGLPYAEVYDRQGNRVRMFTGGNKHAEIDKLVAELLKKP